MSRTNLACRNVLKGNDLTLDAELRVGEGGGIVSVRLIYLIILTRGATKHTDFAHPEVLAPDPQVPEERDELLMPVSELHEALPMPRGARSSQVHSKFIAVCSHMLN